MTEWGVVGVLVALIGLYISITKPLVNLNTTITLLSAKVDELNEDLKDLVSRNSDSHERIFNTLDSHEHRIIVLEEHDENKKEKEN